MRAARKDSLFCIVKNVKNYKLMPKNMLVQICSGAKLTKIHHKKVNKMLKIRVVDG
jgi:hypothetical protein